MQHGKKNGNNTNKIAKKKSVISSKKEGKEAKSAQR